MVSMPERAHRKALAASVVLSAGLLASALAFLDPFLTNDGAVMAMVASGTGLALQPDEHLVFTSVLLGRVLAALARRAPDVPWYGLHLLALQAVSWTGLFYARLARDLTPRGFALCVLAFGTVGLGVLVNLQFTSTAFLAVAAGACLWLQAVRDEGARGRGIAAAAVALMLLGSLERFDPFALLFAIAGAIGLGLARLRPPRAFLAIGGAALALALGAHAYDQRAYQRDPGWRAFREFIPLLPEITDYGRASQGGPALAPALAQAGWTENDHRLFMQWFHADPDVYSADRLRRLLAAAPATPVSERLVHGVGRLRRVAANPAVWAVLLALPLVVGPRAPRATWAAVVSALLSAGVAALLLAAFRKSAPQVYVPLFAFPLLLGLALGPVSRGGARRALEALRVALAAAGLVASALHQWREGRDERARSEALWTRYEPLLRSPDRLVVAWYNGFPFEVVRPLASPARLRSLRLVSLGWSQRTPLSGSMLVAFGSADLVDALADPRTVLLGPPPAPAMLTRFAAEHRGLRLAFEPEQAEPFPTYRGRVASD